MLRRLALTFLTAVAMATLVAADAPQPSHPALSDAEKQAGWRLLFDGTTTAGWRGLGMELEETLLWDYPNFNLLSFYLIDRLYSGQQAV